MSSSCVSCMKLVSEFWRFWCCRTCDVQKPWRMCTTQLLSSGAASWPRSILTKTPPERTSSHNSHMCGHVMQMFVGMLMMVVGDNGHWAGMSHWQLEKSDNAELTADGHMQTQKFGKKTNSDVCTYWLMSMHIQSRRSGFCRLVDRWTDMIWLTFLYYDSILDIKTVVA